MPSSHARAETAARWPLLKPASATAPWSSTRHRSTVFLRRRVGTFVYDVALNRDGSRLLVNPGGFLVDSLPQLIGTFPTATSFGGALHPTFDIGYRSVGTTIEVLNTATRAVIGTLPLGNSVSGATSFNGIGRMDISAGGKLLAVITNNGFSVVRPFASGPPPQFNIVQNGTFGAGTTAWQTFATPDPSYLEGGVSGGVFQFNRVAPPADTSNQAVVFQETGVPLTAGAPIQAQFDLGNSSSVRKRMSVLLIESDFSDISVCTFWLPPGSPLASTGCGAIRRSRGQTPPFISTRRQTARMADSTASPMSR